MKEETAWKGALERATQNIITNVREDVAKHNALGVHTNSLLAKFIVISFAAYVVLTSLSLATVYILVRHIVLGSKYIVFKT